MKSGEKSVFFQAFIIIGIILFMAGIHNIDNSWNMLNLEKEFNLELADSSMFFTLDEGSLYSGGMLLAFTGFIISITAAIGFGLENK